MSCRLMQGCTLPRPYAAEIGSDPARDNATKIKKKNPDKRAHALSHRPASPGIPGKISLTFLVS